MREASNGCTQVVAYGTVAALWEWPASRDISCGLHFVQRRRTAIPKPVVHEGELAAPAIGVGELPVFEESNTAIEFEAIEHTGFIIGSAVKHPYHLVPGAVRP
jgi:hypothetical protein